MVVVLFSPSVGLTQSNLLQDAVSSTVVQKEETGTDSSFQKAKLSSFHEPCPSAELPACFSHSSLGTLFYKV